jgi:hypothetical protein
LFPFGTCHSTANLPLHVPLYYSVRTSTHPNSAHPAHASG